MTDKDSNKKQKILIQEPIEEPSPPPKPTPPPSEEEEDEKIFLTEDSK